MTKNAEAFLSGVGAGLLLIITIVFLALSCSVEPNSDSGGVTHNPERLVGHWSRYMALPEGIFSKKTGFFDYTADVPMGKNNFYTDLYVRNGGTWRYEIPGYAWAEGTYDIVGKRIYFTNPGCQEAIGTYVYVFYEDFAQLDLQVEEDACNRFGFIAGLWWRYEDG